MLALAHELYISDNHRLVLSLLEMRQDAVTEA